MALATDSTELVSETNMSMKSLFTRLFSNLLISSLVVLVTMVFIAFVAIKYSVYNWNTSKKTDLENLTKSIISDLYQEEGRLDEAILHQALEPYLVNSRYLFVFDAETQPILLLDQGKRISQQDLLLIIGSFQVFFQVNPPQDVLVKEKLVAKVAVRNRDFYTYQSNRDFVSTIINVASIGIAITTGLSLLLAFFLSSTFSRQTLNIVSCIKDLSDGKRHVSFPSSSTLELDTISQSAQLLQRQLEKEESLREQWMQDISHDLRTPITAIKVQLEAMGDGILDSSSERIGGLLQELERVELLVRDLSELSRYESPEMEITLKTLTSCSFMDDMRERFAFLCQQKSLGFFFDAEIFSFSADEHLLQRCVSNIIQNAIQHTESGGSIAINFFREKDKNILKIKNTGSIPEEHLEHVFNRFYRGDKSRTFGGSGLGLTIAKAIMDLHQGSVTIGNTDEGYVCVNLVFPEIFNLP